MNINPDIFKAYDIRGKFPAELNHKTAELIGYHAARFLAKKRKKSSITIRVMQDVRTSSPTLKEALIRGIISQGSNVEDAGVATTPLFYFSMQEKDVDAGIMVTASHNPPEYNGFKIRGFGGAPVSFTTGLEAIKRGVLSGGHAPADVLGNISRRDGFVERYAAFFKNTFSDVKTNIVIDASGGAVSVVLPRILHEFPGIFYTPLFFEPDGSFKYHPPNPLLPASQRFVTRALAKGGYKLGVLFDGDGDRILFFDERGNSVRSDWIAGLIAAFELLRGKKGAFVFSANTSKAVHRFIELKGGQVVISKVGYIFVRTAMRRARALLGAEVSGHIYFREFGYDECGIFALLKILQILASEKRPFSELLRPFTGVANTGEINYKVKDADTVLLALRRAYKKGVRSDIDGLTIEFPRWWFNARPSNTEPVIRLVVEADTEELLLEKARELGEYFTG